MCKSGLVGYVIYLSCDDVNVALMDVGASGEIDNDLDH